MLRGIIFAGALALILSSSCSVDVGTKPDELREVSRLSRADADMVVEDFTFDESSFSGRNISFAADKAFYYEEEKLLFLQGVRGSFTAPSAEFSFFIPEAVYDRDHDQLVALSRVSLSSPSGLTVSSRGGVLDFDKSEVYLERDVVMTSPSMSITAESGEVGFETGVVMLRKVEGEIKSLEGAAQDIREVTN